MTSMRFLRFDYLAHSLSPLPVSNRLLRRDGFQRLFGCVDGVIDVCRSMRGRNERRFKLRRRKEHSTL